MPVGRRCTFPLRLPRRAYHRRCQPRLQTSSMLRLPQAPKRYRSKHRSCAAWGEVRNESQQGCGCRCGLSLVVTDGQQWCR